MTSYFERNAGQPQLDVIDFEGDPMPCPFCADGGWESCRACGGTGQVAAEAFEHCEVVAA